VIRVLFFAGLREQLECAELQIPVEEIASKKIETLGQLREQLAGRDAQWRKALADSRLQVALNHEVAPADARIAAGDEIAFFPPVTGG
jgi:sulfur-carrier protein